MKSTRPAHHSCQTDVEANRTRVQADARLVRLLFVGTIGFWSAVIFAFARCI
jgi:hypothetical protein